MSIYIGDKGKFILYTPEPNSRSKEWRGNTARLPKKYQSPQTKISIRHIDGRYDIFVNDRYLQKLTFAPIFQGDMIHIGNHQVHRNVIINAISIVYL